MKKKIVVPMLGIAFVLCVIIGFIKGNPLWGLLAILVVGVVKAIIWFYRWNKKSPRCP